MLKSRGFWLGILVSLVFIGLFVRSTDFGEVKTAFEDANYGWLALALPVYYLALWVRTVRWQYLLRPVKHAFARRTMGLAGRQPRLVRGLPLEEARG